MKSSHDVLLDPTEPAGWSRSVFVSVNGCALAKLVAFVSFWFIEAKKLEHVVKTSLNISASHASVQE